MMDEFYAMNIWVGSNSGNSFCGPVHQNTVLGLADFGYQKRAGIFSHSPVITKGKIELYNLLRKLLNNLSCPEIICHALELSVSQLIE